MIDGTSITKDKNVYENLVGNYESLEPYVGEIEPPTGADDPNLNLVKAAIAVISMAVLVTAAFSKINLTDTLQWALVAPWIWLFGRGIMQAAISIVKK